MKPPIRKATLIVRLWTDGDPSDEHSWHGTVDHIGSGLPYQFRALDQFIIWLRQELAKTEDK